MDISWAGQLASTEITDNALIHNLRQVVAQTKQSDENITTEQIVEAALLEDPSVDECAVLMRETETSSRELVAYVVSSRPFSPIQLQSHLETLLPAALLPSAYVPVSTLPLTSTGHVDKLALASFFVLDSDLVQRWEERVQSMASVEQVAVVVQEYTGIPPLHLSDLLPDWTPGAIALEESVKAPLHSDAVQSKKVPLALAISDGEPLRSEQGGAPTTLPQTLQRAALQTLGNKIIYLQPDGCEIVQSYAALLEEGQRILAGLRKLGLKPQDKVILQLNLTQDIIPAFWGCMLGGFIPVIMAVPPTYGEANGALDKLCHVWQMLDQPLILTSGALTASVRSLSQWLPFKEHQCSIIETLRTNKADTSVHQSQADDVAFLTLTSGSTGIPKCIMLTHRNILSRARGAIQLCQHSSEDVILNWLPFDHIGSISDWHLRCVYLGCKLVYVSKEYILGRILNWLDLLEKYRVTHSWAPNFAYSLINDAIKQNFENKWNLDCVKSLLTAGESVTPKTVAEFIENLTPSGLKSTTIQPAFGMAEFGSGITYFQLTSSNQPQFHTVDRDSLGGAVVNVSPEHPNSITFTSLGPVIPGVAIRIVDDENRILPEDTVGRLQVKGLAVFPGYYKAPEANLEVFLSDGWFNTGDLGFISEGCLVITGRAKETIIINGANYYNGEIEAVVEEVSGVEVSYTAACAVRDVGSTSEKLAIFFSCAVYDRDQLIELSRKIQERVVRKVGVKPAYLIPVEREAIPKTAIGKIQRSQLGRRFEAGEFDGILKRLDILSGNANTLPDWFYRKIWCQKEVVSTTQPTTGKYLVFLDQLGLGAILCAELNKLNLPCVTVEVGSDFNKLGDNRYRIEPNHPEHYRQLLASLWENDIPIAEVFHLWTYDKYAGEISSAQMLERSQDQGLYSLLFLIQALAQCQGSEHPVRLYAISSYTQHTSLADKIAIENTPILGLLKTITTEMPWLDCRHIDLPVDALEVNAAYILQEIGALGDREVAYRNGQRLVPSLEKIDFRHQQKVELPIQRGGMYLLSGGLGGIGVEIASYLLKHYQVRLLVVGRTPLTESSAAHLEQASAVSQRIEAYLSLEQLGGEIIYEAVDVCDLAQLQQVVDKASSLWQCELDGVIHLAGVLQEHLLVDETRDSLAATLRPKLLGTWTLSQLLKDKPKSLFISFSSVNAFFGGTTVGAYAAANSFLEGFSHYQRYQCSLRSYCFAWSMWDEVGMSRGYQMKELSRALGYYTIKLAQGLQSLLALLHHDQAEVLVGLDGTNRHIRRYRWTQSYCLQTCTAYFTAKIGQVSLTQLEALSVQDRFGTRSTCRFVQLQQMPLTETGEIDRQELAAMGREAATSQVAPRTELELKLASIWQEVLGVPQVGIHDNFFELGGTSLLALRLFSNIEKTFGKNLPQATLFQAPTVEQQASLIQSEWSPPWSSLVAIQPNGSKPPLFCVHALWGDVWYYYDLACCLGSEQPFYGLQGQSLDGKQAPHTRIEDMAAHYIREIRTLQPQGPYYIGGWCVGGQVAVEIAQQLQAQGEKVAMLVLFDAWGPEYFKPLPFHMVASRKLRKLLRFELKEKLSYVLEGLYYKFYSHNRPEPPLQAVKQAVHAAHEQAVKQAIKDYVPQVYSGRAILFQTTYQPPDAELREIDPQYGWGSLIAGGLEIHEVPGNHDTMWIQPHVQVLAQKLRICLQEAQLSD